jgi:hypothetical protein
MRALLAPCALRLTQLPLRRALPREALPLAAPRLRRVARAALRPRALSSAGRTAAVTGAYISVAGVALLAAPHRALGLLFTTEGISAAWTRVFGVLCLTFGSYYGGAAALEARGAPPPVAFYASTVFGRVALAALFAVLVAGGLFPQPGLLLVRPPAAVRLGGSR